MNRTGLIVALTIAGIVGVVFGWFPQLDLRVSHYFYEYVDGSHNVFAWRVNPPAMLARDIGLWIGDAAGGAGDWRACDQAAVAAAQAA